MALRTVLAGLLSALSFGTAFSATVADVGPDPLKDAKSFREILSDAKGKPVHIIYVHGIASDSAGLSKIFQKKLRAKVPALNQAGDPVVELNHRLDVGSVPNLTFLGKPIWDDKSWGASSPFVDRYTYNLNGRPLLIVDEVNWWPLVFPLKCRALVAPEAELGGVDSHHLHLCAALSDDGNTKLEAPYYPFLSDAELNDALKAKRPIGGAAWANGEVKRGLMNWGLSDAVIALGPMQVYFRAAIDKAFEYASKDREAGTPADHEYVLIAESLGSFITLDAWQTNKSTREVLQRTAYIYLFANQFALLELGRLGQNSEYPHIESLVAPPQGVQSPLNALSSWALSAKTSVARPKLEAAPALLPRPQLKQIVAFSDPTDALTFLVPKIEGAHVTNVLDRNGFDFLHWFADPLAAHVGHHDNDRVLDVIVDGARAVK